MAFEPTRRDFFMLPAVAGLAASAGRALAQAPTYRRTYGIVSNLESSDPDKEADVIMTAVTLGFATAYIRDTRQPMKFDMDPKDDVDPKTQKPTPANFAALEDVTNRVQKAVSAFLKQPTAPVTAGRSTQFDTGGVIMGVYKLAGQERPAILTDPFAPTSKAYALWEKLAKAGAETQYVGRGAYTGFVETPNNGDPIGPLSTVRMVSPAPAATPHPRWLPSDLSPLWTARTKTNKERVNWGLIMPRPDKGVSAADGEAAFEKNMEIKDGMKFVPPVLRPGEIVTYTHGMIQAIYKAYHLGPACKPFEIAVGTQTTKLASCLPCSLFMHASGYPPTSIHLGSGESWAPLYAPYTPAGTNVPAAAGNEAAVIRDLNNAWYEKCLEWMKLGLEVLDKAHINDDHVPQKALLETYLKANSTDKTIGGVLVLDAITVHKKEQDRLKATLKA